MQNFIILQVRILVMTEKQLRQAKKATQIIFLVCGLSLSSWAPMVPIAKDRLFLNEAELGVLLLLLGAGALLMMPLTGFLISKLGSRKVILVAALVVALVLPLLLIINNVYAMGAALFAFGCCIGSIDVAMNSHGIQVQNASKKTIMSSLHGLFSVGGLLGSIGIGFLIKMGLNPVFSAILISVLLVVLVIYQYPYLLNYKSEREIIQQFSHVDEDFIVNKKSQWFNKSVLLLGLMCFIVFLAEGAMLDWSAIFLREFKDISLEFSGIGYAAFSVAMAVMRLLGDSIITKLSSKTVVVGGSLLAFLGISILVFSPWTGISVFGFVLLGIGAANIVPVFFSEGGKIDGLSPTVAIPMISTLGYAGQLVGPALLGFIAHQFSLIIAFESLALLFVIVAVVYKFRK